MNEYGIRYWVRQVRKTRIYGSTYVHAGARAEGAPTHNGITFSYTGYGRSLEGGGHRYKVYAYRDGKPVRTKELETLK